MKYLAQIIDSLLGAIVFIVCTPLGWIGLMIVYLIIGGN